MTWHPNKWTNSLHEFCRCPPHCWRSSMCIVSNEKPALVLDLPLNPCLQGDQVIPVVHLVMSAQLARPSRITMVTWSTRGARSAGSAGGAGNSDRNGASTARGTRFIGLWKSIGINWLFSWSEEMRKKRVYHLLQNHVTSAGSGFIKPCMHWDI